MQRPVVFQGDLDMARLGAVGQEQLRHGDGLRHHAAVAQKGLDERRLGLAAHQDDVAHGHAERRFARRHVDKVYRPGLGAVGGRGSRRRRS